MVDKLILGLVIVSTLTMCSDKPKTTEQIENKVTQLEPFKSVYDTLDQMEIPITLTPDSWGDLYEKHLEKYGPRLGENTIDHPYARLTENKNFKAFVFVSTDETGSPSFYCSCFHRHALLRTSSNAHQRRLCWPVQRNRISAISV